MAIPAPSQGDISGIPPPLLPLNHFIMPVFTRSHSDPAVPSGSPRTRRAAMLNMFRPYRHRTADTPTSPRTAHPLEPSFHPLSPDALRLHFTPQTSPTSINFSTTPFHTPSIGPNTKVAYDISTTEDIEHEGLEHIIILAPQISQRPRLLPIIVPQLNMNRTAPGDGRANVSVFYTSIQRVFLADEISDPSPQKPSFHRTGSNP